MKFCSVSFVLLFSFLLVHVALAQGDSLTSYLYHFCQGVGNSTSRAGIQYKENINHLLFKQFIDNVTASLFYSTTLWVYPAVYGLYSCRGDISVADCKACIYQAGQEIYLRRCKNEKNAMIWTEGCFVRYANTSFVSKMVQQPERVIWSQRNISVKGDFDLAVFKMFQNLTERATSDPSGLNYATTEVPFMEPLKLYGLVQCTRDISRSDCKSCLNRAVSFMFSSKLSNERGIYLCPSCTMSFELFSFRRRVNSLISIPVESEEVKTFEGSTEVTKTVVGTKEGKILLISVFSTSAALLLALSALYLVYLRRKRIKRDNRITGQMIKTISERSVGSERFSTGSKKYTSKLPLISFDVISIATNHFSEENKVGEGGFGPVYKGTLPNGEEMAVKRHVGTSTQGLQEYENEVSMVANLQHRNLVKLLGCCLEADELLLIYEYMPNKSLDTFLSGPSGKERLDWRTRFSIINGIARGMLYLHEDSRLRIIHRDLKASNVLLDHEMNPKISDFGMARIFYSNQNAANTNRVMGTYGYMAPEYAMEGLFSVKSDVYSYGVLLLEIISGKKNTGFHLSNGFSLVSYAWKLWSESETRSLDLLDASLKDTPTTTRNEVVKCIHIALLCVQDDPADRPTMSSVVLMLGNENAITLQQPSQPCFTFNRKKTESSMPQSTDNSINDVTFSVLAPR